jgi:uncharacterized membrane protein (DUF106 family)
MIDWWAQLNNAIYAIVAAVIAAFVVLIRKVLTNEKQISILKAEIETRNQYRQEADERVNEALDELRTDVKDILKRMAE